MNIPQNKEMHGQMDTTGMFGGFENWVLELEREEMTIRKRTGKGG